MAVKSTAQRVQAAVSGIMALHKSHGIPLVQDPADVDVDGWVEKYRVRWQQANEVRNHIHFVRGVLGRVPYPQTSAPKKGR